MDPTRLLWQAGVEIPGGESHVLDLRGADAFVVFLDGGTATWQPCAADGTTVPGTTTTAVSGGTRVPPPWIHVVIAASGATARAVVL